MLRGREQHAPPRCPFFTFPWVLCPPGHCTYHSVSQCPVHWLSRSGQEAVLLTFPASAPTTAPGTWFVLNKFCVDGWKRRNDWGRSKSRSQFLPASLCCICVNSQWAAVGGASSPAPLMRGLTTAMQANGQSQGLERHCVFLLMVLHSCDVDQKEQLAVRRAGLNQLRA